jgi:hypothetical protein
MNEFKDEEELKLLKDGEEVYKGCPKCETDEYLMDIEKNEITFRKSLQY